MSREPFGPRRDLACPWCHLTNTRHERRPGEQPQPGDVSLCWRCEQPSLFTALGVLVKPDGEQYAAILASQEYKLAMGAKREAMQPMDAVDLYWPSLLPRDER